MTGMVNHPPHYTATAYEPIDIIAAIGNPYCRGNALKYLARAGRKGDKVEDLKKARWYVERMEVAVEAFWPMQPNVAIEVATAWDDCNGHRAAAIRYLLDGSWPPAWIAEVINKAITEAWVVP